MSALRLMRLKPFDVSTAEGRSQERHRRVALTTVTAVTAKVVGLLATLVTVPLTLHYLGKERYGMWMTMSSVVLMLTFADFGIGNGLMSAIAKASGQNDQLSIRRYASSGLYILSVIAALSAILFFAFYGFIPWAEVFNVNSPVARAESGPAMAVLVLSFILAIPLNIVQRVQMGLQQGFLANLWQSLSSVLALAGIVIAVWFRTGLPWLLVAFAGTPLIASLVNSIVYFIWQAPETAPALRYVTKPTMLHVAKTGILFFVLQVVGAVLFASDNIIIAQVIGASAVAEYSVPQRLFSYIPIICGMVTTPLWPAYGEAIANGDIVWVRKTLHRSLVLILTMSVVASLALTLSGPALISFWVHGAVVPTMALLAALGVWQIVQAGGNAVAMFLNGAHVVKFQVVFAIITGVVAILSKIAAAKSAGITGVIWASSISYLIFTALPMYWFVRRYFRGLSMTI